MTADELQRHLWENVYSVHTLAQLREHVGALRAVLYRSTSKKMDDYLRENLPEQFSFLSKLLQNTQDVSQNEKLLELVEKIVVSFEILYLQLPYSPTENQLREYKKAFSAHVTKPFVIKVELEPNQVGSVTWEFSGRRHSASVFTTKRTAQ